MQLPKNNTMAETSFLITKTVDVSGKWVPIVISELSEISNVIMEIKSVSVKSNKPDVACPWIASWNGSHIMKATHRLADSIRLADNVTNEKTISKVHGVTGMDEGLNITHMSAAMQNNIRQYFLSDLHMAYAEAKSLLLEKGTLKDCLDKSDVISIHSELRSPQNKKIDCMICNEQGASNPISKFLQHILCNRSTACLLEAFSHEQVQYLQASSRNVDTSTFPGIFYKDTRPQFPIVPLEGLQKMFDFFHEIELESNLYYISDKQKAPIISVYVPEHPKSLLTITCQLEVSYRSLDDPFLSSPPECGPENIVFNHPKLLSLSQMICGEKDFAMLQTNLSLFDDLRKFYKK